MKKWVFWLLSLTWGMPWTLIGILAAVVLEILGYKPQRWGYCRYYEVGRRWGGVSFGPVFIVERSARDFTKDHEHGHAIQNCYYGPLMPFMVCLPSALRWWMRRCREQLTKKIFVFVWYVLSITVAMLVGRLLTALGVAWGEFVSVALTCYLLALYLWLMFCEIPKYEGGADVDSYGIWFEAQASRWGEALLEKLNGEE